jgi:hypothetical protein
VGDALRADAEQGGDIADRQSFSHQLNGRLAGAGGRRGSNLVSLPAQLADLLSGGAQAGIPV